MSSVQRELDDAGLLGEFARTGEAGVFAVFARRHVDWIYSAALRMTREAGLAEDVTQGVLLAASRKAGVLAGHPAVVSWLFRATRYGAHVVLRAERRRKRREEEVGRMRAEQSNEGGDVVAWGEIREELAGAVARLSGGDREAILLRFYRQLSHGEVAVVMGVPEETARKRVNRALGRLRKLMGVRGSEGALGAAMFAGVKGVAPGHVGSVAGVGAGAVGVAKGIQVGMWLTAVKWAAVIVVAVMVPVAVGAAVVVMHSSGGLAGSVRGTVVVSAPAVAATAPDGPARDVAVNVVDGEGKPVEGATAALGHRMGEAKTDANGAAILRVPAHAHVEYVYAYMEGVGLDYFAVRQAEEVRNDPYHLEEDFAGPMKFVLNGAKTIRVHVADSEGKGLTGVQVYPWYFEKPRKGGMFNLSFCPEFFRKTDAGGDVGFGMIPADATTEKVGVWAKLEGYTSLQRWYWEAAKPAEVVGVTLEKLIPVAGRVVDADGKSVEGATVMVGGAGRAFGTEFRTKEAKTDKEGRFGLNVDPNEIYVFVAKKGQEVSRQVGRVVLKEALTGPLELKLEEGIRVFGRATAGEKGEAVKDMEVSLELRAKPELGDTEEMLPNPENSRQGLMLFISQWMRTDREGRFEFWTCPGDYYTDTDVGGERNMQNFILKEGDLERKVNNHGDHAAPVPLVFHGRVVRADQPGVGVGEAKLEGQPVNFDTGMVDPGGVSDKQGNFELRRVNSDLYLFAASGDGTLKGLVMVEAGAERVTVPVGATATARGRLVDKAGKVLAGKKMKYGIEIRDEKAANGLSTTRFGGDLTTGADGRFELAGLMPGQEYHLSVSDGERDRESYWMVAVVTAEKAGEMEVGGCGVSVEAEVGLSEGWVAVRGDLLGGEGGEIFPGGLCDAAFTAAAVAAGLLWGGVVAYNPVAFMREGVLHGDGEEGGRGGDEDEDED